MAIWDSISNFFGSKPAEVKQIPQYNQPQQAGFGQLLNTGLQGLQQGQGQFKFQPIANQARQRFETQTIPSLAERFASSGNNAPTSGVFAQQLQNAGSQFNTDLAAMQAQYDYANAGRQQDLMKWLIGTGLTPQFQNSQTNGEAGLSESILPWLGKAAVLGGLGYATGGTSGALAAILGQIIQKSQEGGSSPSFQSQTFPNQTFGNNNSASYNRIFNTPQQNSFQFGGR